MSFSEYRASGGRFDPKTEYERLYQLKLQHGFTVPVMEGYEQYGLKYITAVPNNIYGPCDNFDLENGHVVPAIIRKFHENAPTLWGDGSPLREFTYSEDIARALLLLIENYEGESPINIGNADQISIRELAELISIYFTHIEKIDWDVNKPAGQHKKPSSNKLFLSMFPNFKYTSFHDGMSKTVKWFKSNYPNVRGVKK